MSSLTRLLRRRSFAYLLAGQTISGFGDWMATVALMAIVLELTGSSLAVGGILVLRLAPTVVAGPLTARIVRRWDRRRTMLAMDLFRVGVALAIPLVDALWWVYVWAFLMEVGGLLFLPARDAAIPDLLGGDDGDEGAGGDDGDGGTEEDLSLANGLVLGSSYGTIPLGAGAFGAITALAGSRGFPTGTDIVFWVDAFTFLASFAAIARIPALKGPVPEEGDEEEPDVRFLDAFRLPLVRAVAPAATVVALGLGTLFSLGIVYVREVLAASNTEFGVLVALFGVGAAIGLGILHLFLERNLHVVLWAVALQGVTVALMSQAPAIVPAYAGAIVFGGATAVALTGSMSALQEHLADEQRIMAFTAFHVLIRGGLAVAALGAGAASDLIQGVTWPLFGQLAPARVVLLVSGVLVFLTALASRSVVDRAQEQAEARAAG